MNDITNKINEQTQHLVDLLVQRREYEASHHANNHGSIFVGYVADQRPDKRAFHFVSGTGRDDSDIDPVAVKVLTAIYAKQPKGENSETPKVINHNRT